MLGFFVWYVVQKCGAVDGGLYMMIDGVVKVPYRRILIKRKQSNTNQLI